MAYPPAPAPAPQYVPVKQGNGFGVTALVLGLVGLVVFSWIPGVNLFTAIPLAVLAIIFGLVALAKAGSRGGSGRGTGATGLITGLVAVLVAVAVNVWIVKFFEETGDQIKQDTIAECAADGTMTEAECEQIWEDAEADVYGG